MKAIRTSYEELLIAESNLEALDSIGVMVTKLVYRKEEKNPVRTFKDLRFLC